MTVLRRGIEYVPAAAAARKLATTHLKILILLKEKKLEGEFVDGSWFVTTASLEKYVPADPSLLQSCRTSCKSSVCGCS